MLAAANASSGGGNFLVPNATFIVELLIFIIVLGIMAKFVLPPVRHAMEERQSTIRAAANASDEGRAEADRLSVERRQVLDGARSDARSIIEGAGQQVNEFYEDARSRGQAEHERLIAAARNELSVEHERLRDESYVRLGELVVRAASQVIGASIDSAKHQSLIDEVVASSRAHSEA